MKAISLHQPYASLIAAGIKTTETRSWSTSYRGPIAIHAAQRWTAVERVAWERYSATFGERFPRVKCVAATAKQYVGDYPPLGCVVAVAELVNVVQFDGSSVLLHDRSDVACGDFSPGRYGWRLDRVLPLVTPLPLKGRQGLWTLTDEQASEVLSRASGPHSLVLRAR